MQIKTIWQRHSKKKSWKMNSPFRLRAPSPPLMSAPVAKVLKLRRAWLTVTEYPGQDYTCWRINYGSRDYLGRRGGDLMVEVGLNDGQVKRVLRGQ